jgi:hypothetical protein
LEELAEDGARTEGQRPTLGKQSPGITAKFKKRWKNDEILDDEGVFTIGMDEFSKFLSFGALVFSGMDGESNQIPVLDGPAGRAREVK